MKRIEVRLEEDVHKSWTEHVDQDNRYKTKTQLIRFAVGEQIDRDNGVKSGEAGEIDSEQIEQAVVEPLDKMKNELTSLSNDVIQIQHLVESMGDDEDQIMDVAMGLHDLIPKVKTVEDAMDGSDSGRVSDLGDRFKREVDEGVQGHHIKIALARLENDVPQVQSQIIEGERIYYEQQ